MSDIVLTDEQKLILEKSENNLYISAAPGSGKSTMLSQICARLLEDPLKNVILVTFTNKAAESIIEKCGALDRTRIIAGTFHGIAYRLMRRNGLTWSICDEHKKRLIIKTIFNCKKDKEKFEAIYEHISNGKSKWPRDSSATIQKYNKELQKYNLLDFDDIIYKFNEKVQDSKHDEIIGLPQITHLLVDELQDTSGPQLEMLKKIVSRTYCKIVGVADDDQSIYSWRGARPENVTEFIEVFGCEVMNMGINFRSDQKIVKHSAKLIENNKVRIKKKLQAHSKEPGKIFQYKCANPFDEIAYIIIKCQQNIDKKIAILYRNRTFKNHLEFELRKAGLEYTVNDFLDITDRSAVRVMISCLKIAVNRYDVFDIEQASKALKGLGSRTVSKLKEEADDSGDIQLVVSTWLLDDKKKKRLSSINSLFKLFQGQPNTAMDVLVRQIQNLFVKSFDYQDEMKTFLIDITKGIIMSPDNVVHLADDLGLNGKEEHNNPEANIELSTVHGYKGLEQPIVIMPFCDMYLESKPGKTINIEDERRLFYVAVTRAKNKIYMTYSGTIPRFIKEMEII